jgi:hypothetical protein
MHAPNTVTQIAEDRIDRYRSFGAFGKPAWQSHVQLRAMLRQRLGDRYANYFAVPTFDPDAGVIRWTVPAAGTVRGWHALPANEQALRALDMEDIRGRLMMFASELRGRGDSQNGSAAAFTSLLEQAMKVPSDGQFLFIVGEQPVIAFWGFENPAGGAIDPLHAQQTPATAALPAVPVLPPVPAVSPEPALSSTPGLASVAAAAPIAAAVMKRRRTWWWLLLALLLLLLFLLLMRSCGSDGSVDLRRALPGLASPGAPPPSDSVERGQAQLGQGGTGPALVDPARPAEIASGPGFPPIGGASAPSASGVADPARPVDPKTDPPLPIAGDPPKDPKADRNKPPIGAASVPHASDVVDPPQAGDSPPRPRGGQSNDPKSDAAKGERNQDDRNKPPIDPRSLKLPDDSKVANKMDFLQGDWKAGEGLVDKATKQPLDLRLKFGKDGQGELTLRRPDGTLCSGPVQGRMNGGKLSVEGNQAMPCGGGGSYGAPRLECSKSSNGQTDCQGVNPDGSRYYMDMRRQ